MIEKEFVCLFVCFPLSTAEIGMINVLAPSFLSTLCKHYVSWLSSPLMGMAEHTS